MPAAGPFYHGTRADLKPGEIADRQGHSPEQLIVISSRKCDRSRMRIARALALASLAFSCSAVAQESRQELFEVRDRAMAERSAAQGGLESVRMRLEALPTDMSRYQSELEQAQVRCTETFADRNAYAARQAECRRLSAELDAWRARLEGGADALLAEAEPLQVHVDAANASIAELERRLRALGPSTEFEREMAEARQLQLAQVDSLRSEIDRIVVPSPPSRVIHEGVILGMMSGPDEVAEIGLDVSPFSNCGNAHCTYDQLIAQGRGAAYPRIKNELFGRLRKVALKASVDEAEKQFPDEWTVEYKFADSPNAKGEYVIPFFSRVSLDETRREILALGFKAVELSFIRLSKDSAATKPKP